MKNYKYLINIVPIMTIILLMMLLNIFFNEKIEISQTENRKLATMPNYNVQALKSGEYFAGLDAYISDNFYNREIFVKMNRKVKRVVNTNLNILANKSHTTIIKYSENESNAIAINEDIVFFIIKHNYDNIKRYTQTINSYKDLISHVPLNVLVAPTVYEFIEDDHLKENETPQRVILDYARENLGKRVNYIDVYNELFARSNQYIFYKSDHHWTSLGAYYAYRKFVKTQNINPIDLDVYPLKTMNEFTGSFYNFTNNERVNDIKDEMSIYEPKTPYKCYYNWENSTDLKELDSYFDSSYINYRTFLGGDYGFTKIETENKNNQTLLVIKDSYANAFMQYLIEHYNKIIIIDPRYFREKVTDVVKNEKVTSVLFINNIETLSDNNFINNLNRIL